MAAIGSYAGDWLRDKIIGGAERMANGAKRYAYNEHSHSRYLRDGDSESYPSEIEQRQYELTKIDASVEMAEGLVDQAEGYTTLMTWAMGGLECIVGQQGTKLADKAFREMVQNIVANAKASADDIVKQFIEAGYKASSKEMRTGRGHMIMVEGHSQISTIKGHGGGGTHGLPRLQIIRQNKSLDIKIVNGKKADYLGKISEEIEVGRQFIFLGD